MKAKHFLLTSAALPATFLLAATAFAQTRAPDKPATSSPTITQPPTTPSPGTQASPGSAPSSGPGASSAINETARNARFHARISRIKSALQLSEEQQKLWPSVESALREAFRHHEESFEKMLNQPSSGDFVERLKRRGEMMSEHGSAMTRLADAIKPLNDTLSDDQKRRVAALMRDNMRERMGGMMDRDRYGDRNRMGEGRGEGRFGWDRDGDWRDRNWGRNPDYGDRYGRWGDRGGPGNYNRQYDQDNRWRSERRWNDEDNDYGWRMQRRYQDRDWRSGGDYDPRNYGQRWNRDAESGYGSRQRPDSDWPGSGDTDREWR